MKFRKFLLQKRGIIKTSKVRAPGPQLTNEDIIEMNNLLTRLVIRLKKSDFSIPSGIN